VSIVASADAGPEDVKADVVDDTADDHKSTRSGDKQMLALKSPGQDQRAQRALLRTTSL